MSTRLQVDKILDLFPPHLQQGRCHLPYVYSGKHLLKSVFQTKRKNILDLASEFCLTGFCQPGKPGIICVEGSARNKA